MWTSRRSAFTLIELLVTFACFSTILLVTTLLLRQSVNVWTSTNSHEDASMGLFKARRYLVRDLSETAIVSSNNKPLFRSMKVPDHLGGGTAIWFLSARADDGTFQRNRDGTPYWQRNILYYIVIPSGHDSFFNNTCHVSPNPNGDDYCPHKVLVRMVIDNPPITDPLPTPPSVIPPTTALEPEKLLTKDEIEPYLVAPYRYELSALGSLPNVDEVQIVATDLLWFNAGLPNGLTGGEVKIDLRATAIGLAHQNFSVGDRSLYDAPFTEKNIFTILTQN